LVIIPSVILSVICIIHLIIYRNAKIIKDQGFPKNLFFQIGIIFLFTSQIFTSHINYGYCAFHFLSKHIGVGLVCFILLIHIISGVELGIVNYDSKKPLVLSLTTDKISDGSISETLKSFKKKRNSIVVNNIPLPMNTMEENQELQSIFKTIKKTHYLYVEGLFIYFIFITSIILYIILKFIKLHQSDHFEQDYNGEWLYTCSTDTYENILNIFEFLLIIILFSKSKKLWNLNGIFKNTKYISYAVIVWIATGPFINVINILFIYLINIQNIKNSFLIINN